MDTGASVATPLPMTAWEQAAVVVLFAVVFIFLIGKLLAWFSTQQKNWQDFIGQRDDQWQKWMDKANTSTTEAMSEVTRALEKLSEKIDTHDEKVETRITGAVEQINKRRPAR